MVVSDNKIEAERLSSFFRKLGKSSSKIGEKSATNVKKSTGRALDLTANIATAAASRNHQAALSASPEVINIITWEEHFNR